MAAVTTLLPVFFMLALGLVSRLRGWITLEQKDGASSVLFGILFPILIFNLLSTSDLDRSVVPIVGYTLAAYLLALFVVGPLTARFTGREQAHFSKYLLATNEGGNVALPLFLSIVGTSSTTVIFDLAGTVTAFVIIPIMVAQQTSKGASAGDLVRNMVTNPVVIAVTAGLLLNLTGLMSIILASPFGPAWTATLSTATSPIVALILFCLGYDLAIDKSTIGSILRLGAVRLALYALVIGGFFLLFPARMADREFLMAVLIYFTCPTGFAMAAIIQPTYKDERDAGFVSAFMSLYIIVTLVAYTCVVLFLA